MTELVLNNEMVFKIIEISIPFISPVMAVLGLIVANKIYTRGKLERLERKYTTLLNDHKLLLDVEDEHCKHHLEQGNSSSLKIVMRKNAAMFGQSKIGKFSGQFSRSKIEIELERYKSKPSVIQKLKKQFMGR